MWSFTTKWLLCNSRDGAVCIKVGHSIYFQFHRYIRSAMSTGRRPRVTRNEWLIVDVCGSLVRQFVTISVPARLPLLAPSIDLRPPACVRSNLLHFSSLHTRLADSWLTDDDFFSAKEVGSRWIRTHALRVSRRLLTPKTTMSWLRLSNGFIWSTKFVTFAAKGSSERKRLWNTGRLEWEENLSKITWLSREHLKMNKKTFKHFECQSTDRFYLSTF